MMLIQEYDNFYKKNPRQWNNPEHDELVFDYLAPYGQPETFLDIGCGNGHLITYLQTRWLETYFTGLDFSPVAITLADNKTPTATWICTDIEQANLGAHYEVITCVGVAEHFKKPLDGLKACRRLLKEKGIIYLEVPNCLAYRSNKKKQEGYYRINQGSKQFEWHLTREAWEDKIIKAGFKLLEIIKGPRLQNEFIWILTHE